MKAHLLEAFSQSNELTGLKRPVQRRPTVNPLIDKTIGKNWAGREMVDASPTARWTKIGRKLVTPAALAKKKERYEVSDDSVVVLRVLTKDEVQGFAILTQDIRKQNEGEEKRKVRDEKRRKKALPKHLEAADDVLWYLTTVFKPAQAELVTAEPTRSLPIEEIHDEDSTWNRKGVTPSRGQNSRYHGGASDNLFAEGGGRIGVPSGLQMAGGAGGDKGYGGGGAAGTGNNDDDEDGDDSDQQRRIVGSRRKTHPLDRERMDKIRLKLANYRAEYENLQLVMALHATDMCSEFAPSRKSSAVEPERNPVAGNRSYSGSAIATIAFNPRTREETLERVKRQIRPVLISRKNICRSLGSCPACRSKEIRAIKVCTSQCQFVLVRSINH